MKKILLMTSLLFISIMTFAQTEKKEKYINDITKNTTCIFEGNVIETKEAFYDKNGNIFTLIKVKVSKVNFGQTESTEVLIARKGGTIGNREELSSHGGSYISDFNTFFLNNNFVVIEASTNKSYYLVNNIAYDNNFNVIGNQENLFKNYNDFYAELSKSISVSYEKKSPLNGNVSQAKNEEDNISYETLLPPAGKRKYSKTKPLMFEEFDEIKKWWNKRKENDNAWKVKIADIIQNDENGKLISVNLDNKNPNKKNEFEFKEPSELVTSILSKEQRIFQLMKEINNTINTAITNEA